jgi:hypothetical protein
MLFFGLAILLNANSFECEQQSTQMLQKYQDGHKLLYESKEKEAEVFFKKSIELGFLALKSCENKTDDISSFIYAYISDSEIKLSSIREK